MNVDAFQSIKDQVEALVDQVRPTVFEQAILWNAIFETFDQSVASGNSKTKVRRTLIKWLDDHAPFLAASKRTFNRKFRRWRETGKDPISLKDGRDQANKKRTVKIPEEDRERIAITALKDHGGEWTAAYRDLRDRGLLSPELSQRYTATPARRDHVPRAIAREVGPAVEQMLDHHYRPEHAALNGPHNDTVHDECSGDILSGDDLTGEIYFTVPDGKGGERLTRGQFLVFIDTRSRAILLGNLVPRKSFTARDIFVGYRDVCRKFGVFREGAQFENGLYRRGKNFSGPTLWDEGTITLAEKLGIRFFHCKPRNPRAKVVERILRSFQAGLRDVFGWVANDERRFKIEAVAKAMQDVKSGRKTAREAGFLSYDEMAALLQERIDRYNNTLQRSFVMGGGRQVTMTPKDAWLEFQAKDSNGEVIGLAPIPPELELLLMSRWQSRRVWRQAIRFVDGKERFNFTSPLLADLDKQWVRTRWHFEVPNLLWVETGDKRILTIPRVSAFSSFHASPEQKQEQAVLLANCNKAVKTRIVRATQLYVPPARPVVISPATAEKAAAMNAGRQKSEQEAKVRQQENRQIKQVFQTAGFQPPATPRVARGVASILQMLNS